MYLINDGDLSESEILLKRDGNLAISSEYCKLKNQAINRIPERRFRDAPSFRLKPKLAQETASEARSTCTCKCTKSAKVNKILALNGDVQLSSEARFFVGSRCNSS